MKIKQIIRLEPTNKDEESRKTVQEPVRQVQKAHKDKTLSQYRNN